MKVLILAAGKGTRMLPFTEHTHKVLIPINGKPFLSYVLDHLQQAGFTDIGIVAGYHPEKIQEFLVAHKIKATIIAQPNPLGTGHAVLQAQKFCGQDQVVIQGGDNLFSVADLKAIQKKDTFCYILGKEVSDWQKYGVLVTQQDMLIKIIEKPRQFVGNLINTGLYKCTPEIFTALAKITLSERGEYELTDALTLLAQQHKVRVLRLLEYWLDLGSKEDIPKIEEFVKKNKL
ncbi:MAG: NTP transferase domain-containing protein [Candidatus Aenigmarchaeota archaeon]|nr:MAG: bifunctional UDP-N-acetylglucosamine pyrophosphorylase / Glucosamine-1-phosphate N-acetyltransferase [archaeon GW2011_AR9]MBS3053761.1 NTP transferase domain-containing protein [Candidatus Aenigmarchaeota archaeon]MBS3120879.1 NTP transferase domain-containing protein [Candidatus Woesearchaeota archaeon]HIG93045.1 NTP transferase domain-containing protein [Candidatus Woesearchaeota archaeon]HIH13614.1 NTP transferase domain-containing protein [Candidatus Woesearchaeota archaeon]